MTHPFLNRSIMTYSPMQDGGKYIALISGIPMIFRGDTAMQAAKAAKAWRQEQVDKELRQAENAERAAERMRKR